jgi:2-amino-4-hydroxy-6-hydroxymethyldihydropteridine diphosphokinase
MILIGLGSNLPTGRHATPQAVVEAALEALAAAGIRVLERSPWYRSAPVPASDQPWFVNGVAVVATVLEPPALLRQMHAIETRFGRKRRLANEARSLDLDLLAYDDRVVDGPDGLRIPHPRLAERAFVLLPLADVAPGWRHPVSGATVEALIARLPPGQAVARID